MHGQAENKIKYLQQLIASEGIKSNHDENVDSLWPKQYMMQQ